jgi:hypothetical protein
MSMHVRVDGKHESEGSMSRMSVEGALDAGSIAAIGVRVTSVVTGSKTEVGAMEMGEGVWNESNTCIDAARELGCWV